MNSSDFGQLIKAHPEILENPYILAAHLRDAYPTEKANINLMIIAYNAGVVPMLRNNTLDGHLTAQIETLLVDDYSIAEERARWAAQLWVSAYALSKSKVICAESQHTMQGPVPVSDSSEEATVFSAPPYSVLKLTHLSNFVVVTISEFVGCRIVRYIGNEVDRVVIPLKNEDKAITEIGSEVFPNCQFLHSVIILDGILRIMDGAFRNCVNLTEVFIPESVKSIGFGAFSSCPNLTIYAPEGSYAEQYARENSIRFGAHFSYQSSKISASGPAFTGKSPTSIHMASAFSGEEDPELLRGTVFWDDSDLGPDSLGDAWEDYHRYDAEEDAWEDHHGSDPE